MDKYLDVSNMRILIAPHHDRKSGIRYCDGENEVMYEGFLKTIKPHLVIMSDKRGAETTDIEAYKSHCLRSLVYSNSTRRNELKKVITKTTKL